MGDCWRYDQTICEGRMCIGDCDKCEVETPEPDMSPKGYNPDLDPNANRCVCCGAIIPEGRMVCKTCDMKAEGGE